MSGTNQCILEMEKVWKVYLMGEVQVPALRGIDFCADRGEYVTIVGPSGSGKSTLLNIMGCLDSPTAGRILIGGIDTSLMGENDLARIRRKMIGFVFQTFNLIPGLTARENVALPMRFDGVDKGLALQKADMLLSLVGLDERTTHKPSELSGGERQRVAIARSLINDPPIILADEPTGNLDTKSGRKVIEVLEGLQKKGLTLLIITHDMAISERAERRVHLVDGKFVDSNKFKKI
jgi:putative ABC transport system ATP-binding protein